MCAQDEERTIWENSERDTEGWETEWVRRVLKSGAATSHFSAMAQSLLGKGKPGELFHRASPLSEWSLQSAPPEFLHHVILFMGRKTQPSEAQTGRGHITAAAICEWRWFRVFFFFGQTKELKNIWENISGDSNSKVNLELPVCKHGVLWYELSVRSYT